ncbi:S46 family peptidase [Alloprevotella tannerae]|uniref:S46 family peptidase n=1 Tax=Alloprevotella tannerae TaxID=76122 RepID=UPI0028D63B8E|nr:S46 family peptidase [Alloprevotella tannerae]
MKKLLFSLLAFLALTAQADGGMWFLKLMEQQHLADSLKKAGLKMPLDQLYNENGPSLRDAIGQFGRGCTGEVISPDGLVLTNNHCGYSYVHGISTTQRNYLRDGYYAKSRAEELPVKDLTFTFIIAIEDVTEAVEAAAKAAGIDTYTMQSQGFLKPFGEKLFKASKYSTMPGARGSVVAFFSANRFYFFVEQTYKDVRLVVNPPLNIAQFGGNQDNWVYPRHNPDFAIFRIYADKKGQPAAYSAKNVPLKRETYLPISLKGINEGDYTMIMGFPGRTQRFLTSDALSHLMNDTYRPVVEAGRAELAFNASEMARSEAEKLVLQDEDMSLNNLVKNYGGAIESVRKNKLIETLRKEEKAFQAFAEKSGNPAYKTVVSDIAKLMKEYSDTVHDATLITRTIITGGIFVHPLDAANFLRLMRSGKPEDKADAAERLRAALYITPGKSDFSQDQRRYAALAPVWEKNCRLQSSKALKVPTAEEIYQKSIFRSHAALDEFLQHPDTTVFLNDPIYRIMLKTYVPLARSAGNANRRLLDLQRTYVKGLLEMSNFSKAPDANSTQRLTYGHIANMKPRNAVSYDWCTTLEGMFEKENPNDSDYVVNERMRELYEAKDFGQYARPDGKLQTCFISNNDITGGNSGSAVLNDRGEIIGLAFDGNIESLMSDFRYDPKLQRCISADIRYVLWVADKVGGSSYILKELKLVK